MRLRRKRSFKWIANAFISTVGRQISKNLHIPRRRAACDVSQEEQVHHQQERKQRNPASFAQTRPSLAKHCGKGGIRPDSRT